MHTSGVVARLSGPIYPPKLAENACLLRPLLARGLAEHELLLRAAAAGVDLRKTGFVRGLSHQTRPPGARTRAAGWSRPRRPGDRAWHGRSDEVGTEPQAGVWRCNLVARYRQRNQSAGSNPGLRTAVHEHRARRTATRVPCSRSDLAGGSTPCTAPSMPPTRSSPLGHGRRICWSRSGSICRSQSSAAITATGVRSPMPGWAVRSSGCRARLTCSLPWSRTFCSGREPEFARRDAPLTPRQLNSVAPHAAQLFPLGSPWSNRSHGSAPGRAYRTYAQRSGELQRAAICGSV